MGDGKVVSIADGLRVASPGDPHPEVVEELEKLLEEARSGRLAGFALGAVYCDESTAGWRAGSYRKALMVGQLECLKHWVIDE